MGSETVSVNYIKRTNAAIDYIVRNLDGDLSLEAVASAARFSPFHFHRIFKSLLGETLGQFVKRQRLERALYLMSHAPNRSLTDIALECGFASSSDFSRSFKSKHSVSPAKFDLQNFRDSRREEFEQAMASQEFGTPLQRLPAGENPDGFEVNLRQLPPQTVAYIRVLDPYHPTRVPDAASRLVSWANEHNVANGQWLGYMWEDPEIAEMKDCRYDVAVVINDTDLCSTLNEHGEVGRFEFPAMHVAEVVVRGDIQLEQRALDWLFGTWLPQSGYAPASQPAFEAWHGLPFEHGMEHFELTCQLPVQIAQ